MPSIPKIPEGIAPHLLNLLGDAPEVGDRQNYNLPGDFTFWPYATIEQRPADPRYQARAIIVASNGDNIVFNSDHHEYRDAERAIEVVREALTANGPLYNVFAETFDIHTADHGGGHIVTVIETRALIWSFRYPTP